MEARRQQPPKQQLVEGLQQLFPDKIDAWMGQAVLAIGQLQEDVAAGLVSNSVNAGVKRATIEAAVAAAAAAAALTHTAAAAAGLLSMAELVDRPLPSLPAIAVASRTSERRPFPHYPDAVYEDRAYFEIGMRNFRSTLEAYPARCFKLVEFLGTCLPGSADSEVGIALHFAVVTQKCEEVLKQQGHTGYGYIPLTLSALLRQLVSASAAHTAEAAAAGAAMAAAAAAAAATAQAAASGAAGAALAAEPADSRRGSSSGSDAWTAKPDLILACILEPSSPEPSIQQQHSSSPLPSMQRLQQGVVAVGELKVRETLTDNGVPVQLALLYEEGDTKARAVLDQAYSYMVQLQVRLGFITCYDALWLLERRDAGAGALAMSAPIMAAAAAPEPTLMLAMCWLQHTAIHDPPRQLPPPRAAIHSSAGPGDSDSDRPGSGGRDHAGGASWGFPQPRGSGKRSSSAPVRLADYVSGSQCSDADLPVDQLRGHAAGEVLRLAAAEPASCQLPALPALPLGCLEPSGAILGSGATSIVLQGRFQGQACAIKLLLLEDADSWGREVAAYQRLRALQGCCLPKLLGVGLTCQGACYFLALELVRGVPLGCGMGITQAVADAAVNALQQVHELGYVHGDVRLDNLMQQGAASGAVLVDLGRARPGSVPERDSEMASLRQLLHLAQ